MFKKEDTYSYKGWIVSDYFLKRCAALLGHYFVAVLLLYAAIIVLALCAALMFFVGAGFIEFLNT